MLRASQTVLAAWTDNGGLVCDDCARKRYPEITLERARVGLSTGTDLTPVIPGTDLTPVIRYEIDQYGSYASDYGNDDAPESGADDDTYYPPTCDDCSRELD